MKTDIINGLFIICRNPLRCRRRRRQHRRRQVVVRIRRLLEHRRVGTPDTLLRRQERTRDYRLQGHLVGVDSVVEQAVAGLEDCVLRFDFEVGIAGWVVCLGAKCIHQLESKGPRVVVVVVVRAVEEIYQFAGNMASGLRMDRSLVAVAPGLPPARAA